ncbi:MAG: hypothetical protein MUO37_05155 [Methyloceanibacter sp.]|nr:hypothetical protein [Methyloceanibacter sp.]
MLALLYRIHPFLPLADLDNAAAAATVPMVLPAVVVAAIGDVVGVVAAAVTLAPAVGESL